MAFFSAGSRISCRMDEMLPRLATFALLPLTVTISVSALTLARLGFFYSSPPTIVCFRCRQMFAVDELSGSLEHHARHCSPSAAAATVTSHQHVEGCQSSLSCSVHAPKHEEFASESARLKSFERGRVGAGQSALTLSRAGFLYFGIIPFHCLASQFHIYTLGLRFCIPLHISDVKIIYISAQLLLAHNYDKCTKQQFIHLLTAAFKD